MPAKKGITRRSFLKKGVIAYGALAAGRVPRTASRPSSKKQAPVKSSAVKPPSTKMKTPYKYKGIFRSSWYGKNGLLKRYPKINPSTLGGRRCIDVADRAALHGDVKPEYVIKCLKTHGISKQALRRMNNEYKRATEAQARGDRSTDANKRRDDRLRAKMNKINVDYSVIRALVEADIVCDAMGQDSDGIVPSSGRELASAVGGGSILGGLKKFFTGGKKQPQAVESPYDKLRQYSRKNPPAKPAFTRVSLPSGKLWSQIFRIYPGWERALNQPRHAKNARAAMTLVDRVAASTGATPLDVIGVRRKYAISKYALPGYRDITRRERRIFNALLEEKKSNKRAFDYLVRATRSWFANN